MFAAGTDAGDHGIGVVSERDHGGRVPDRIAAARSRPAAAAVLRPARAPRGAQYVRPGRDRAVAGARRGGVQRRLGAARDRHRRARPTDLARRRRDACSCCRAPARPQYGELLRAHDVGLALMYTPHPSLVPLEMASAGLLTVTNTFENKDADALRSMSANLIAAEPTLAGVTARTAGGGRGGRGRRAQGRGLSDRLEPRLGRVARAGADRAAAGSAARPPSRADDRASRPADVSVVIPNWNGRRWLPRVSARR